jgi:hypothetical protein
MVSAILTSAVIAAIVSAIVSVLTTERGIAAAHVTRERMKWRDKIRGVALEVYKELASHSPDSDKLNELRTRFSFQVNPHHGVDDDILQLIDASNVSPSRADEFRQRVALLLKHDWERAKHEANLMRKLCKEPPLRVRFENYRPRDEHEFSAVAAGTL